MTHVPPSTESLRLLYVAQGPGRSLVLLQACVERLYCEQNDNGYPSMEQLRAWSRAGGWDQLARTHDADVLMLKEKPRSVSLPRADNAAVA